MVRRLCVTTMNCVWPHISPSIFVKRPTLASSSGASHFVENAEGAWPVMKHGDQKRQRGESFFSAREKENILEALIMAGRAK